MDVAVFSGVIAGLLLVAFGQPVNAQGERTLAETENNFVSTDFSTQNEQDTIEEVYSSMHDASQQTGTDFILVEHEDQSVTLYEANDDFSELTKIKGYPNTNALLGPNGAEDVLNTFVEYN